MAKKGEKILIRSKVKKLGLDSVPIITADMLDGYTSIGKHAFDNCTGLISIIIPDSITNIGEYAFLGCSGLIAIDISNSVTKIGNYAFQGCRRLTSINIPNSVSNIGRAAFAYCRGLTSIEIPNNVTLISKFAFYNCTSLTSIIIPDSVISISIGVFYGCSNLTSLIIKDKTYKKQTIFSSKCKAYKAFNADMTCRDFQYKEGETYELDCEPILCERGFHACLNLADIFNYYDGKLGKDIVIHEVELDGISVERHIDSKLVAKKITIGKRIL